MARATPPQTAVRFSPPPRPSLAAASPPPRLAMRVLPPVANTHELGDFYMRLGDLTHMISANLTYDLGGFEPSGTPEIGSALGCDTLKVCDLAGREDVFAGDL